MFLILNDVSEYCSNLAIGPFLIIFKKAFDLIQIVVPILVMISLTVCFIKLMSNPDQKKYKGIIKNVLMGGIMVFMLPTIINAVMGMLSNNFDIASCWNSATIITGKSKYIKLNDKKASNFLIDDPNDYKYGVTPKPSSTTTGGTITGSTIDGTAKTYKDVVWDPNDVTKKTNLTSAQLIAVLNSHGGKAKNFIPYATGLITAENKYNVNAFFLIGVEALESGWIESPVSKACNNLGGVHGSSAHPANGCSGVYAYFNSVNDFIDAHAEMLNRNYLTPGGAYYHGKSPSAVVTDYCDGCPAWPGNVTTIANKLFAQVSKVM